MPGTVFTIGHSTHPIDYFLSLLARHQIDAVADVRSSPYSKMNPQFNREALASVLGRFKIAYVFLGKELGARSEDSSCYVNGRVQYEMLAKSANFSVGLNRVVNGSATRRMALLCAEKDPSTCHRAILVCRHLESRGLHVEHILPDGGLESHEDMLRRMMCEMGMATHDLFRSAEQILNEAYYQRGQEIAYVDKSAPVDGAVQ